MTRHLLAVLALPANVLGTIPALLLWWSGQAAPAPPSSASFWAALACAGLGLLLMATTIRLFATRGEGTLAPWAPTAKLVVTGPYRHVRNPMISGVLFNLAAEALYFRAPVLAGWLAVFFLGNAIYLPLSEEPGLARRFGADYERYRRRVPRWIPRLRPDPH